MALMRREVLLTISGVVLFWCLLADGATSLRRILYAFSIGSCCTVVVLVGAAALSARKKRWKRYPLATDRIRAVKQYDIWQKDVLWLSTKAHFDKQHTFISSKISKSLDELLERLTADFVSSWYRNISQSLKFTTQIKKLLEVALVRIKDRLEYDDIIEAVVARIVPIVTEHLHAFYEAEHAVRGKKLNRNVTESEELDLAIAAKYNLGKLHPAAVLSFSDTRLVQQDHLRKLTVRLMPELIPEEIVQSRAVSVLVKEIVSCAVLTPIMQLLSDPDIWNQLIETYGTTMLQDRRTVRKLRAALDQHAPPVAKPTKGGSLPRLSPHDDERTFERFIRAVRGCNNLSDARRFRNEAASQLNRAVSLESQDSTYVRRLQTGKRILDQRIEVLSSIEKASRLKSIGRDSRGSTTSRIANATLKEILHDASGLSYFMEYMDRRKHMVLIQFWLVVEGLRDPLEDDATEDNDFTGDSQQWTEADRLDIAQIADAYLSKTDLGIGDEARETVREFLKAGSVATGVQYARARRSILRAQSSTLEKMQSHYFASFRRSDLFYKLLAISEEMAKQPVPPIQPTLDIPRSPSTGDNVVSGLHNISTGAPLKFQDHALRRSASSNGDLNDITADGTSATSEARRSLDAGRMKPLFDDDIEPATKIGSLNRLEHNESTEPRVEGGQAHVVEAMEAALSNIISEPKDDSAIIFATGDYMDGNEEAGDARGHEPRKMNPSYEKTRERPNLASLGLVNTSSRIGVFRDDDLFGDEEKFPEDEYADSEDSPEVRSREDEIHEAAPSDLGLAEAIHTLNVEIDRLTAQDAIVDTLTKKAELTNNIAELRILHKSKSSLQRELRRKELQRQQYIVQESDNSLFGRAVVEIKSIVVGKEDDGQEYALYVIEVQRRGGEHMSDVSWAVARRYSEFHDLHQRLRQSYSAVRQLEFPRRRLVMKLQRDFLHKRRISLQNYLRQILLIPAVCKSRELRAFLSQHPIVQKAESKTESDRADLVSRIYSSVTEGMDEFLGNLPVLDQLSVAGQNLISAATSQYYGSINAEGADDNGPRGIVTTQEEQAELEAYESQSLEPFVKPLCDLFLETFELNRAQNWLRGRAVVVVLHQLLGGTIERKVRDTTRSLVSESSLLKYLAIAKASRWPEDTAEAPRTTRTAAEKAASRHQASIVLATLLPELAGGVVGRSNAQAAGRRLFATINNARLNAHLAFRLLDEFVAIVFPPTSSALS